MGPVIEWKWFDFPKEYIYSMGGFKNEVVKKRLALAAHINLQIALLFMKKKTVLVVHIDL